MVEFKRWGHYRGIKCGIKIFSGTFTKIIYRISILQNGTFLFLYLQNVRDVTDIRNLADLGEKLWKTCKINHWFATIVPIHMFFRGENFTFPTFFITMEVIFGASWPKQISFWPSQKKGKVDLLALLKGSLSGSEPATNWQPRNFIKDPEHFWNNFYWDFLTSYTLKHISSACSLVKRLEKWWKTLIWNVAQAAAWVPSPAANRRRWRAREKTSGGTFLNFWVEDWYIC